jgi:DNA-binding NarL/FixJ family response regulator
MSDTRVILVDDHNLVRSGLRGLFDNLVDVRVIGEANGSVAAMEAVRRLAPDIVVTDLVMRDMDGVELTELLQREFPAVRVIVLTMHAEEHFVHRALRAGASAYLLKGASEAELELAVRAVLRGELYLCPVISRQVIGSYIQSSPLPAHTLTPRQREILKLIAEGLAAKAIAHRYQISIKTVEAHRSQIMERLGIRDIPGLVKYALSEGLTDLS